MKLYVNQTPLPNFRSLTVAARFPPSVNVVNSYMSLSLKIKEYTRQLAQQGLLRTRQISRPEASSLVHFDRNDYLSLSSLPALSKAWQRGYALYPSGSGSSMVLSGYHPAHQAVEQAFANLLEVDECILFSSGYAANLAVTALLGKVQAHCFIDKEIHASIYDGLVLSQVSYTRYLHNNLENLTPKLNAFAAPCALITEGIFSMSGQRAPLASLATLCALNQAELLVDESHSFGVLGSQGKGAVSFYGLTQKEVPLRIIPLGKGFAAQGAVIAGKRIWIEGLLQAARSLIYSTAVSPALSYGLLNTLDYITNAEDRRLKLIHLIDLFRDFVRSSPLDWADSITPIQQVKLGCPHRSLYYAQELIKKGISCFAIRKPSVTTKNSGLRVVLNYNHTPEQIKQLFDTLRILHEHQYSPIR